MPPDGPAAPPASDDRAGTVKAFIDLGTNSVRLVLVRVAPDGAVTALAERKETVRLGEGEFADGHLTPAAMDRATVVVRSFAAMARASGAATVTAVATAATREARNREAFVAALRAAAGIDVRTISGLEEARLIYLGVASGLHLGDRRALFIDIGGGSTELIVGTQDQHLALDSLRLGAIRLTGQFFSPDDTGPVSAKRYGRLRDHVRSSAVRALQRLAAHGPFDLAVGSSGTAQNLADIAARVHLGRPRQRTDVLTAAQLADVARRLCAVPLSERARLPGINPARADIIVAGAAILETLLAELGVAELAISDRGLREGLIVDDLARGTAGGGAGDGLTVRERSVRELGRRFGIDAAHHRHVARLADGLLESARAARLVRLPARARELLGHAAMLHDVGTFLSYSGHERHAHYLIRHAPLLGFAEDEIAVIAAVARYHRKGLPAKRRPELRALPPPQRRLVAPLAMMLRLAEGLDRTHAGRVTDARFARAPDGALLLHVDAAGDWTLERWALDSQLDAFARVLGARPVVVAAGDGAAGAASAGERDRPATDAQGDPGTGDQR